MTDAEILQGLPPVETIRQATFDNADVIYLSCDGNYFTQFATPMLRSLAATAPGAQVHIHVMDMASGQERAAVRLVDALGLRATITRENLTSVDKAKARLARIYFHAIRFIRFYQDLKRYGRPLWLMDVDALFNRAPSELFAMRGSVDVALRIRPGRWEPWHQFNACVVGATPTVAGLEYFRLIAAYIAHFYQAKGMTWGIDQLAMFSVFEYLRERNQAPTLALLGDRAIDYAYIDDGVVWCNSGGAKVGSATELANADSEGKRYRTLLQRYQMEN